MNPEDLERLRENSRPDIDIVLIELLNHIDYLEKELGEERLCNDLLRKQLKTLKRTKDQEL